MVPQVIGLNHILYHILCKSHTVKELDKYNLGAQQVGKKC